MAAPPVFGGDSPPGGSPTSGQVSEKKTASGGLAAGGVERSNSFVEKSGSDLQQALRPHLQYVVGYNWVVSVSIAPLAFAAAFILSVVLPESFRNPWRPPPVAVLCVSGYIFFEVTSFCLERNWSQVSIWRFFRLAVPLGITQALLCLHLARHDVLGCLLFTSLCLGTREFLFQLFSGRHNTSKESLTAAFMGGSTYGMTVALLCGLGGALVHAVVGDGRKVLSTMYVDVLIALALPLGRNCCRSALNQFLSAATSANPMLSASKQPKLDALVMYGDILFLLTIFMEVPFAFVFLLVPRTTTFIIAVAINVLMDVVFVQALDVFQRRDSMLRDAKSTGDTKQELDAWSPTYCIERPESIFATLSSGVMGVEVSERTPLRPEQNEHDSCILGCLPVSVQLAIRENAVTQQIRMAWLSATARPDDEADGAAASMSPRVSLLLDEHNAGVIGCWAGRNEPSQGSGYGVFLRQERRIALTTHFLASTLALVTVTVALPVAKWAGDHHRTEFLGLRHISATELAIRAVAVLILRVAADILALQLLEQAAIGNRGGEAPSLWENRHELSTFHGWLFRALAATCPLFAVIAATL